MDGGLSVVSEQNPLPPESLPEPLPEIPEENAKGWELIQDSQLGDRMKRALRRVATGESYRQASQAEGYKDHKRVWVHAHKYGLIDLRTERLISQVRRTTHLSLALVEHRLTEDPDAVTTKDAVIVAGIGLDKLAKRERWGQEPEGENLGDKLLEIAAQIVKAPGALDLHVSISGAEPQDPVAAAIDVTPGK